MLGRSRRNLHSHVVSNLTALAYPNSRVRSTEVVPRWTETEAVQSFCIVEGCDGSPDSTAVLAGASPKAVQVGDRATLRTVTNRVPLRPRPVGRDTRGWTKIDL